MTTEEMIKKLLTLYNDEERIKKEIEIVKTQLFNAFYTKF